MGRQLGCDGWLSEGRERGEDRGRQVGKVIDDEGLM